MLFIGTVLIGTVLLATSQPSPRFKRDCNIVAPPTKDSAAVSRVPEASPLWRLRGGGRHSNTVRASNSGRGGDAIGSLIGYTTIKYHPWQVKLLSATSICMGGGAAFALHGDQAVLGSFLSISSLASLNYWRKPGPGYRRDADFLMAGSTFVYCTLAGQQLCGALNAVSVASFAGFLGCFRRSFRLSAATPDGGDGSWARWHALGHVCVTLAAIALAAGRADEWLLEAALVRPARNPLWTSGLATAAAVGAYDGLRMWRTHENE